MLRNLEEIELGLSVREELLLASKAFRKRDVVETFYETLLHRDRSSNDPTEDNVTERHRVGIFSTSVEGVTRTAVSFNISGASKDFSRRNLDFGKTTMEMFVVTASFSVFSHLRVTLVGTESTRKRHANTANRPKTFANIYIQGKRKYVLNRYHLTEVDPFLVITSSDSSPGTEVSACTET